VVSVNVYNVPCATASAAVLVRSAIRKRVHFVATHIAVDAGAGLIIFAMTRSHVVCRAQATSTLRANFEVLAKCEMCGEYFYQRCRLSWSVLDSISPRCDNDQSGDQLQARFNNS
jgi:hypothetical protein